MSDKDTSSGVCRQDANALDCKDQLPSFVPTPPLSAPSKVKTIAMLVALSLCLSWAVFAMGSASMGSPASSDQPPVSAYTAPSAFPQSAFSSYYNQPTGTEAEPRPAVSEYNAGKAFDPSVEQPYPLPTGPPSSEAVYPKPTRKAPEQYASQIKADVIGIFNNASLSSCQKCVRSLQAGQQLAQAEPKKVPEVLIELCTRYKYASTKSGLNQSEACKSMYSGSVRGSQYSQVLSYANLKGDDSSDALYLCSKVVGSMSNCSTPAPVDLHANGFLDTWFGGKVKRQETSQQQVVSLGKKRTGAAHLDARGKKKTMKVLHFSDIHVDPRFFVGGEGRCTSGQCCRSDSFNSTLAAAPPLPPNYRLPAGNLSEAAVYWGNYKCDSPWPLAVSAMQSVTKLNGGTPVDMSLYTGDMVTHDSDWHISKDLVSYTQQTIFDTMKKYLGSGPVFSAIGNHDTAPSDSSSPHSLPDAGPRNMFSFDWHNLQRLFVAEGWFTHEEAKQVSTHYGGYSVSPRKGLRIICLNTDFWYKGNIYNFINSSEPDNAGILRFLTDELQSAHSNGERAWIVGHVLTGWDGSNPLANPTNLFYQIVDHYSPSTIAHIFFGHTHEDQFNLFYANNGTERSTSLAKAVSFMAPSITPGSNVNSALRLYHIDPETYEVVDFDQYYTQIADFAHLPTSGHGPIWRHLYSAREAYSNFSSAYPNGTLANGVQLSQGSMWPTTAPLNATFWAALTDEMLARPTLVQTFSQYQARNSTTALYCTSGDCLQAIPCYARSGSAILGQQCPTGFASVQG